MSSAPSSGREANAGPSLASLLAEEALTCVFQPITGLDDGSVFAHEALVRGPQGTPMHAPDALLAAARAEGLLLEFEIACVVVALRRWSALNTRGRLFVNLSASALVEMIRRGSTQPLLSLLRQTGLPPKMLVVELTEHERVDDMQALCDATQELHTAGVMLALDDFGNGRSSLRLWSELAPEIVKIDKYFTAGLSTHAKKLQTFRALHQLAEIFGTALVAEGIETAEDLRIIRDLNISYGQGYFFGRPAPQPRTAIEPEAASVLEDRRVAVMPMMRNPITPGRLKELQIITAPTVTPQTRHDELGDLFERHPSLHAIAVVEDGIPVGLIDRRGFIERYVKRYFKELYGMKSCMTFANVQPRLIERDYKTEDLIEILRSDDQRYLTEGFIVTENGRYVGLGASDQLVRSVTEARIEAARHANPLTFLPGNIPITEHIDRLLSAGSAFVACYADLNNFKPFNDHYGYWRGDEMIRLFAKLAVSHSDQLRDFVGHVGGDDFILLFQRSDWEQRCESLIEDFNAEAKLLYDDAGRAADGIDAEDRHGVMRHFPLTTVSIGAVRVRSGVFRTAEQVANAAAIAKQGAKKSPSGLLVDGGDSQWSGLPEH